MVATYDWAGFYTALCERSPRLLRGIDDDIREIISLVAGTDAFWSDGLQEVFAEGAREGDLRSGVVTALGLWRENVLVVLSGEYGVDLDWGSVTVEADSPLIAELVQAATPD